eukprot:scaffold95005_cov61-Cyclotella_meneghiniana.AAC.1
MAGRHYGMMSQVLSLLVVDMKDVAAQVVNDRLICSDSGVYMRGGGFWWTFEMITRFELRCRQNGGGQSTDNF